MSADNTEQLSDVFKPVVNARSFVWGLFVCFVEGLSVCLWTL